MATGDHHSASHGAPNKDAETIDELNGPKLISYLKRQGLVLGAQVSLVPLEGGVSSDIMVVQSDVERLVVKRSLGRLKVSDEWLCDTKRNATEVEAIRYASRFFPDAVPRVIFADPVQRLFVMEHFGPAFVPWKSQLLAGQVDLGIARATARLLATLHRSSWRDEEAAAAFDTGAVFYALRIEPYLLTTGLRHPDLGTLFREEAERLAATSLALVHGDWSSKNMLISAERAIILDWEAAWFGDPAFDAAFFLNLIYLKLLHNRHHAAPYFELLDVFRKEYGSGVYGLDRDLEGRILRLTLMLLLARIDGKSPAEYITSPTDKDLVRTFVRRALLDEVDEWKDVDSRWKTAVGAP
jgi:aminoglycoside phosphotransferase (APT) family kinase protein